MEHDSISTLNAREFLVLDALRKHEIKQVVAYFNGENDSGGVEEIKVIPVDVVDDVTELPAEILDTIFVEDKANSTKRSLRDAIEDVCCRALSDEYGGWEINDGSSGSVTLTPLYKFLDTEPIVIALEWGFSDSDEEEEYNDE